MIFNRPPQSGVQYPGQQTYLGQPPVPMPQAAPVPLYPCHYCGRGCPRPFVGACGKFVCEPCVVAGKTTLPEPTDAPRGETF